MTMDTAALILFTILMGICLLATLAFLLHYVGFLQHVQVSRGKPTIDNVWIAYKDHVGPYDKCGPHFTEVSSLLPKLECIGIYYDDPKEVSALAFHCCCSQIWTMSLLLFHKKKTRNCCAPTYYYRYLI